MACITKRRGRYVLDFYDQHGKRRWKTLKKGTTKKRAKDLLRENTMLTNQTMDNPDGQAPTSFQYSHYAIGNLLYTPVAGVMAGAEFQWGQRHNFSDGFSADDYRIQFSFKYNFSFKLGGKS